MWSILHLNSTKKCQKVEKRDRKVTSTLLQCLQTHDSLQFNDDGPLTNVASGVTTDSSVNVDQARRPFENTVGSALQGSLWLQLQKEEPSCGNGEENKCHGWDWQNLTWPSVVVSTTYHCWWEVWWVITVVRCLPTLPHSLNLQTWCDMGTNLT